tara:strand:- start:54 stop:809 length:756 start_codon:yes stop_codon:yes gene_type:complete
MKITANKDQKKIDLKKSFVHFIGTTNSWRTNIKSILTFENNTLFLVKECRAEHLGANPFNHSKRYEHLGIVDGDKTHFIRTKPLDVNFKNIQLNIQKKIKKNIVKADIEYLSFERVHEIVSSDETSNIYCEIEYEYESIKYNLTSKCEYINYNTLKNSEKYLQPLMGYVPFILNNNLTYGYVVIEVNEKVNGNLEFLLNEKSSLLSLDGKDNLIKKLIKNILNNLLFFMKQNNFTKLISLENSKINFFRYI